MRLLRTTYSSAALLVRTSVTKNICAQCSRPYIAKRLNSTAEKTLDPKITTIVDSISNLTLLETADLVSALKVKKQKHFSIKLYALCVKIKK